MPEATSEKTSYSVSCNCDHHSMKHRQKSVKQMEKIFSYHDQIRRLINDDTKKFSNHILMKKIDEWEHESIIKIEQTANDIREEFKKIFTKYTNELIERFNKISQQLNKARLENNFLENNLKIWFEKLQQLKKDYQLPKTINIRQDDNNQLFINKIKLSYVSIDKFYQSFGDITTNNSNLTLIHGPSNGDATLRGKKEYSSGTHQFRFYIDQLGIPKWVFFGIISKNTPIQSYLYKTPSVYGWAGHYQVWLNGYHHHQYNGYQCEIDKNHIIQLFLDCDQQKIRLTNETTSITHEIEISIIKCPFPWTLYIGLYGANDQIHLLPA